MPNRHADERDDLQGEDDPAEHPHASLRRRNLGQQRRTRGGVAGILALVIGGAIVALAVGSNPPVKRQYSQRPVSTVVPPTAAMSG